jgi:hypothetical protein
MGWSLQDMWVGPNKGDDLRYVKVLQDTPPDQIRVQKNTNDEHSKPVSKL